jgi:hypothetical protein
MAAIEKPQSFDFYDLNRIGFTKYAQGDGGDINLVEFNTNPITTSDGYEIEKLTFRIPASVNSGIRVIKIEVKNQPCLSPELLDDQFSENAGLQTPSPWSTIPQGASATKMSRGDFGGATFIIKSGCVTSLISP